MSDIAKRLRENVRWQGVQPSLEIEAADVIDAQAAEIARLREALKPFAEMSPLDIFRARTALEAGNE